MWADLMGEKKADCMGHVLEDYVLFDCPGQVELFTHHESLRNIFFRIQKFGYRVRIFLPFLPNLWLGVSP